MEPGLLRRGRRARGRLPGQPLHRATGQPGDQGKPYLYLDDDGDYRVFLPALRHDTAGTTWAEGKTEHGTSEALDTFFIAQPGDSAREINFHLAAGRNLLLTPGVYRFDRPLNVVRRDTVVLGLGMPSLTTDCGDAVLRVADVDGVRLAGFLVDAGARSSAALRARMSSSTALTASAMERRRRRILPSPARMRRMASITRSKSSVPSG